MYSNGASEHYIDLSCSFGKTNSPLEFCPPVRLFALPAARRCSEAYALIPPKIATHVDDIYGGFASNKSYQQACSFRTFLCESGNRLTLKFNMDVKKTPLPASTQIILGHCWNSIEKSIKVAPAKIVKYRNRIAEVLAKTWVKSNTLEKLHGNLTYASCTIPFGRPFLATITEHISPLRPNELIRVTKDLAQSLSVWDMLLRQNWGISMEFVLGKLRRATFNVFVDASTSWGIGGCCGSHYFQIHQRELRDFKCRMIAY